MVLIIEACKEKPPSFFRIVLNQFLTTPGHKTVHNLALFHQINFFQASSFSLHGFSSDGAMHLIKWQTAIMKQKFFSEKLAGISLF